MSYNPTTADLHKTVRPAFMPSDSDGDVQAAIDDAVSDASDAYIAADVVVSAAFAAADDGVQAAASSDATTKANAAQSAAATDATTKDNLLLPTRTAGSAAGAVALRFGGTATEGLEIVVINEVVDMLTTPAASWALTSTIPAGAVILSVQANLQDAITAATAVKVGIGVTADPDKYGLTATLNANAKVDTIPAHVVLASTETIAIFAVDTNGDAAGTIGGGAVGTDEVRVRIVYAACNSLDNAA